MDYKLLLFPDPIMFQIYSKLDNRSKKALKSTCMLGFVKCSLIEIKEERFIKIAKLILSNYDVILGPKSLFDIVKFLFYPIKLTGLGECHVYDYHRWLNSNLINLIWDKHSQLHIEGGEKSVEFWKENNSGQLQYLKKEIAETATSWDASIETEAGKFMENFFDFQHKKIQTTKLLLNVFSEKTDFSLKNLSIFLENAFDQQELLEINEIPEIIELKNHIDKMNVFEKEEMDNLKEIIIEKLISFFSKFEPSAASKMENILPKLMQEEDNNIIIELFNVCIILSIFTNISFDQLLLEMKETIPEIVTLRDLQEKKSQLEKEGSEKLKLKINCKILKIFIFKTAKEVEHSNLLMDKADIERDNSMRISIAKNIIQKVSGIYVAGEAHFNRYIVRLARTYSVVFEGRHTPVLFLKPKDSNSKEFIEHSLHELFNIKYTPPKVEEPISQKNIDNSNDEKNIKIRFLSEFLKKFDVLKESDIEEYIDKNLFDFSKFIPSLKQVQPLSEMIENSPNQTMMNIDIFFDRLLSNELYKCEDMLNPNLLMAYEKLFDLKALKHLLINTTMGDKYVIPWFGLCCVILAMELKRTERKLNIN